MLMGMVLITDNRGRKQATVEEVGKMTVSSVLFRGMKW